MKGFTRLMVMTDPSAPASPKAVPVRGRSTRVRALLALLAFVLGLATVSHRVCERDAAAYYDGDAQRVDALAASVASWTGVITNPTMLVEVLSSSTEQYDRGLKWVGYQLLPSLNDYLLVSQDRAHIEHFGRIDHRWIYSSANAGERIVLTNASRG